MEIWNECTRLISSVIVFYNTFILSELLGKAKNDKQIDIVTQVSLIAWAHLNFLGNYEFHRKHLVLDIHRWLKNMKIDFSELVA